MKRTQSGVLLIEAMVALLIFALGVLGMVALGGIAVASQSDSRARTDASALADEIASTIALNVARIPTPPNGRVVDPASLLAFEHQPTNAGYCGFTGTASAVPAVLAWAARTYTTGPGLPGLPGSDASRQQIVIDASPTGYNRVAITICWQAPNDTALRRHTLVTYVN